jgi:DNA polymerase V
VGVWIETNRFRLQDPQYAPCQSVTLPVATDDTAVITAWCVAVLRTVFRKGYRYVKAGVVLDCIRPKTMVQGSLFDALRPASDLKRKRLMTVLDNANHKWGRESLAIGSADGGRAVVYLPPFRVVFLLAISLSDTNR